MSELIEPDKEYVKDTFGSWKIGDEFTGHLKSAGSNFMTQSEQATADMAKLAGSLKEQYPGGDPLSKDELFGAMYGMKKEKLLAETPALTEAQLDKAIDSLKSNFVSFAGQVLCSTDGCDAEGHVHAKLIDGMVDAANYKKLMTVDYTEAEKAEMCFMGDGKMVCGDGTTGCDKIHSGVVPCNGLDTCGICEKYDGESAGGYHGVPLEQMTDQEKLKIVKQVEAQQNKPQKPTSIHMANGLHSVAVKLRDVADSLTDMMASLPWTGEDVR